MNKRQRKKAMRKIGKEFYKQFPMFLSKKCKPNPAFEEWCRKRNEESVNLMLQFLRDNRLEITEELKKELYVYDKSNLQ